MNKESFLFWISVKMLASSIYTFIVVFMVVALFGLLILMITQIIFTGSSIIDANTIIIYSVVSGFIGVGIRMTIMKRYSKIRVIDWTHKFKKQKSYLKEEKKSEKKDDKSAKKEESSSEKASKSN